MPNLEWIANMAIANVTSFPVPSALVATFDDAWEKWNEAKTLIEETRTAANFFVFWLQVEHALMLASLHHILESAGYIRLPQFILPLRNDSSA